MYFRIECSHLENTLTCPTIPKSSQRFFEQTLGCEETCIPSKAKVNLLKHLRCCVANVNRYIGIGEKVLR